MWVARDKNGILCLYSMMPLKSEEDEMWYLDVDDIEGRSILLPFKMLPEVKWEDEKPAEVEITIKNKKNNEAI